MDPETKRSLDFYQSHATSYDEQRWKTLGGSYTTNGQREIVAGWLNKKASAGLDVACGTGRFTELIARCCDSVTALDGSKEMVNQCKRNMEKLGVGKRVTTINGLASSIPFPNNAFDVVTCINALNHIPDPQHVINEIFRVLKKDGIFIGNFTNWFSFYMPIALWVKMRKTSIHGNVFTDWFAPWEPVRMLQNTGFALDAMKGFAHCPTFVNNQALVIPFKAANALFQLPAVAFFAPQIFLLGRKP